MAVCPFLLSVSCCCIIGIQTCCLVCCLSCNGHCCCSGECNDSDSPSIEWYFQIYTEGKGILTDCVDHSALARSTSSCHETHQLVLAGYVHFLQLLHVLADSTLPKWLDGSVRLIHHGLVVYAQNKAGQNDLKGSFLVRIPCKHYCCPCVDASERSGGTC